MPKKATKTTEAELKEHVSKVTSEIKALARKTKDAYSEMDPETKKKVVAGIAALGGLLVAKGAVKKAKKKKIAKKKKTM